MENAIDGSGVRNSRRTPGCVFPIFHSTSSTPASEKLKSWWPPASARGKSPVKRGIDPSRRIALARKMKRDKERLSRIQKELRDLQRQLSKLERDVKRLRKATPKKPPRQKREKRSRVFAMLKRVGLHHRRHHHPLSLSGGEQQRLAIARALVNDPEILLADEPTGNLDPELTLEIMDLIAAAATRGTTVIVATHDHALVERFRRRVVHLEDGRVQSDLPARPVHL